MVTDPWRCGVCNIPERHTHNLTKGDKVDTSALHDLVNHPRHYTTGNIEVLDFILDQQFNFLAGQVIKYVSRYRHKGTAVQDLEKAEFYLKRLIAAEQVKSDT